MLSFWKKTKNNGGNYLFGLKIMRVQPFCLCILHVLVCHKVILFRHIITVYCMYILLFVLENTVIII